MNAILALLIRQGLAACGGFFTAHNITGSSTTSIIVGLIMLAIPTVWSWIAKCIHLEDNSKSGWIENSEVLRTLIGSIVSQGITALSVYFATDANNPELLGIAVANAAASKLGAHQKLAFLGAKDALKALTLMLCALSLTSCDMMRDLVIRNAPLIEEGIIYGVRTGVQAGVTKLKKQQLDAKQPKNVQPDLSTTEHTEHTEPEMPECLKALALPSHAMPLTPRIAIPDHGKRVAFMLATGPVR